MAEFYASENEEIFSAGPYSSREEAVSEFPDDYDLDPGKTFWVGERGEFRPYVSAFSVIDCAITSASDEVGDASEDWLSGVSKEDRNVLQDRLTDVFCAWLKEFGHEPRFFPITHVTEHTAPERMEE